jgi:photosystem II stability/assembly factor-like uncharacterized protein
MRRSAHSQPSVAFALSALSANVTASWQTTTGITDADVTALLGGQCQLLAGTDTSSVLHSTDQGRTWESAGGGLPSRAVRALAQGGGFIFAATDGGLYRSADAGLTWGGGRPFSAGLTHPVIYALAVSERRLYAGTNGGVFFANLSDINTP